MQHSRIPWVSFKKLRTHDEWVIPDVVLDKPLTHLKEVQQGVQQHLLQTTGTDVCIATLYNCFFFFFAKCWIYLKQVNIKGPTKKWWAWTTLTVYKSFWVHLIEFVCTTGA